MNNRHVGARLGATFGVLVAILMAIGLLGLSRMDRINANVNEIVAKRWAKVQLVRRALTYSNRNSRITMEIFVLTDRAQIDTLLATRAENTKQISDIVAEIERHCETEEEKGLLAAVKEERTPYIESYLRALHLLIDQKSPEAARAVMVEETTPLLLKYHTAWENFVQFQSDQVDRSAKRSMADYAAIRAFSLSIMVFAVIVATAIAVFATRDMVREVQTRIGEREAAKAMYVEEAAARDGIERELRHSDERMRMAVEAARIGFWDWDVINDEQVWSNTWKELLGLPPDSPTDSNVLMNSVHPDDRQMMRDAINQAMQNDRDYALEFRVVWPDGSVHWQVARGRVFYDETGRPARMAGIVMDIDRRKLAEESLRLQAEALDAAANSIVITDKNGTIVWTNRAFSELTGYAAAEACGQNPRLLCSGKHDKAFYANLWQTITAGKTWRGDIINRRKDGSLYTEEQTITLVRSDRGEITHFVAIKQDVTERKRAEEALRQAEEKYRAIFDNAVIGIIQTTPEGRPLSINRALAEIHGYDSPEQLLAEVSNAAQLFVDPSRLKDLTRELDENRAVQGVELEVYRKDGTKKWVLANLRGVRNAEGKVVLHEGTVEDITQRKAAEGRVQFLAYYDALTELPNRTLLQDRLVKAFAGAQRRKEKVALLFLDLDRFKIINDSLGHSVGDLLLQSVAGRIKGWAREQDTVARLGGDEFLVVLNGVKEIADAAIAAERLMKAMTTEFVVQGHSLSVACSLGISIFPEHGTDAETLVKHADTAMYCAKENGRNNFQFFTQDMNAQVVERLALEHGLRKALERKELFLAYQPQMDIVTGKLIGLEALLRWQHPEMGLVPPDKFIRIAENSGQIVPIGEWVLRTACAQVRKWHDEGLLSVSVAVNVSAVQFRQEGFCQLIRKVLHETCLAPHHLELELTESLLLSNADVMLSVLRELKEMGIKLSIDDFGTGYSSLSYLRQFPVSRLKIDRSFVRNVAANQDDAAITGTIISMAKSLNLKVIAEGVETEEQMSFLRAHQCDEIQGYYFSKPLPADDLADKLRGTAVHALAANQGAR